MPWANRSSAHELEGGISVKPTQNVIVHPLFYNIKLELLHSVLSFYLLFIQHQLSAGNLYTCQCSILNYVVRHITVSTFRMKKNNCSKFFLNFGIYL